MSVRSPRWLAGPLAALVVASQLAAPSASATSLGAPWAQWQPCDPALQLGRWPQFGARLEFAAADIGPVNSRGSRPWLCIVYFPREDVYQAVLLPIEDVNQFRAAKATALDHLRWRGFDLCRLTGWTRMGPAQQPHYESDDFWGIGAKCSARVAAGDPGAAEWVPRVEAAIAAIMAATAEDIGLLPDRALTILVLTDQAVALETYQRYVNPPEVAAAMARAGRSVASTSFGLGSPYTGLVLLNLTIQAVRSDATLEIHLVHEYTHFAQRGVAGADMTAGGQTLVNLPNWFVEGQGKYQEYRRAIGGTRAGALVLAARMAREGIAPTLPGLVTREQWLAGERTYGTTAVYTRGYAAVVYLVERLGPTAAADLLQAGRMGTVDRFHALIQERTGLDLEALDRALTDWLVGLPRYTTSSADGQFTVDIVLYPDGARGEALTEFVRPQPLCMVGGAEGVFFALNADGTFAVTRPARRVGLSVELEGRLGPPPELTGSFRLVDAQTGCDTGSIRFENRTERVEAPLAVLDRVQSGSYAAESSGQGHILKLVKPTWATSR